MSSDGGDVTPQQTELIVSYSAATGNDDLDVCRTNLFEHNWDLTAAINATMSPVPQPEANVPTPSSSSESLEIAGQGIRRRQVQTEPDDLSIPPAPPLGPMLQPAAQQPSNQVAVHRNFLSSLFSSLFAYSRLLLSSPWTVIGNTIDLCRTWWHNLGPELTTLQQVQDFNIKFNKKYDQIVWLNCSYSSAISSIRTSLKPIIVFLANEEKGEEMAKFAQLLLSVKGEMESRVQFWGCDVRHAEGARTGDMLFVGTFPSLLIAGMQDKQQSILFRTCSPAITFEELKTRVEQAEAELVSARHEEQMRQMDRQLREEQDIEFERTMEADRRRLEEEAKKREEEEMKIKAAEARESMRIKRQTEHRERRISAKQNLAAEPTNGGIRIQFKLPNGSRATRSFFEEQSIGDIFLYVQSLDDAPGDCYLSTVFPPRKINPTDTSKTLSDFGIKNNEQLMVQAISDEFSSDDSDESD